MLAHKAVHQALVAAELIACELQDPESILISRYQLERTFKATYLKNIEAFVLCGSLISQEAMTNAEAAERSKYACFFNKFGHFKQLLALSGA